MERLMVIKLIATGCTAEAWLNGLPMARVTPLAPQSVVPVHEAALAGPNRLELVVGPDSAAQDASALLQSAPHDMAAQAQASRSRFPRGSNRKRIWRSASRAGAGSMHRWRNGLRN